MSTPSEKEYQLIVQLAVCSTAALGAAKIPAEKGDYGWSPAYQNVLNLYQKFDRVTKPEGLRGAVARGWCHPKNSHKEMDADLAEAIVGEIIKLGGQVNEPPRSRARWWLYNAAFRCLKRTRLWPRVGFAIWR